MAFSFDFLKVGEPRGGMDPKPLPLSRNETRPEPDEALPPFMTAKYPPEPHDIEIFGCHWIGPAFSEFGKRHLVARYDSEDSDGHPVEIYCVAVPTRFYYIVVFPRPDREVSNRTPILELGTGSSSARLAADIAAAFASGMLGLNDAALE